MVDNFNFILLFNSLNNKSNHLNYLSYQNKADSGPRDTQWQPQDSKKINMQINTFNSKSRRSNLSYKLA